MNYRRKKRKNNLTFVSFLFIILFFIFLRIFILKYKTVDFFEYYNLSADSGAVIVEDKVSGFGFEENENDIYFCFDFVKSFIDPYIFWDEAEKKLTITTEDKVIRMKSNELDYYINNEPLSLDIPFYIEDNTPYIPSSILKKLYNIKINKIEKSNIISINFNDKDFYTAETVKSTKMTFNSEKPFTNIKGKLGKGTSVYIYPDDSTEELYKIKTDLGYVGYAPKKIFSEPKLYKASENTEDNKNTNINKINGKINLAFEQVTNYSANNKFKETVPDGVNVLSPTWFSFEDKSGNIRNIADKSYVDSAHKNSAQVWALITDNFDAEISHAILSATDTREYVIRQLLAFVSLYDLHGINIDFEAVPVKDGDYYIQFLRELAPLLRQQGAVLSADMFVPKPWTEHYNRKEAAKTVDYIIVMGYDEHYAGSNVSGSVASIGWSEEAVTETLNQSVPKDKLILAVPFYSRIWKETSSQNGIQVTSKAYGMDEAKNYMLEKNASFKWLDDIGQYYAEYTENGQTYKLWLEDEKSIGLKLDLVNKYSIAGCASWKRGFESENTWNIIKEKLSAD